MATKLITAMDKKHRLWEPKPKSGNYFPIWLQNRLISRGLEPVIKSCIASNYRKFSSNVKIISLIPVLLAGALAPVG